MKREHTAPNSRLVWVDEAAVAMDDSDIVGRAADLPAAVGLLTDCENDGRLNKLVKRRGAAESSMDFTTIS